MTKGWYAKNYQDLIVNMQGKINTLNKKICKHGTKPKQSRNNSLILYHTTERSTRRTVSDSVSENGQRIDLSQTLTLISQA